jgi:hypothetical protein
MSSLPHCPKVSGFFLWGVILGKHGIIWFLISNSTSKARRFLVSKFSQKSWVIVESMIKLITLISLCEKCEHNTQTCYFQFFACQKFETRIIVYFLNIILLQTNNYLKVLVLTPFCSFRCLYTWLIFKPQSQMSLIFLTKKRQSNQSMFYKSMFMRIQI